MSDLTKPTLLTRRKALQFLAAAPMLPLGALASSTLLSGCATDAGSVAAGNYLSASFTPMAAPSLANAAAMATTSVASGLTVQLGNNTAQNYKLAYQPFFITGDQVPDGKGDSDHGTIFLGGLIGNFANHRRIIDRRDG